MEHRHNSGHGKRKFITKRHVNKDPQERKQDGNDGRLLNFLSDGRAVLVEGSFLNLR
jgi:hypothetical protein